MNKEVEMESYSLLAFRFRFGIGVDIEHESNRPIMSDDRGRMETCFFEGLCVKLPFIEILWGLLWQEVLPEM